MKRLPLIIYSLSMMVAVISPGYSQETRTINLDDIHHSRTFNSRMLYGLTSMNDGLHYTVQNRNLIEKFSYKTGEAVETLFDAGNFSEVENDSGYSLKCSFTQIRTMVFMEEIHLFIFIPG